MTNSRTANGDVWRLHRDGREVARLTVIDSDWPWVYADVEALPGFDDFSPIFLEEQQAWEAEDWDRADACYERIRAALTLTYPDGEQVAEFLLHIDGAAANWRWHDVPFDTESE